MYREMYEKIGKAKVVYIYRHVASDYDALGSQYGLASLIEDNFKDVKVKCMGEENARLNTRMKITHVNEVFETCKDSLAIVLDTANHDRIDGVGYDLCADLIKVDHHIVVDSYGKLNIEDPHASSTSELICRFYDANADRLSLSKEAATYLYYGLIGDSNRFMYEAVSSKTMKAGGILLDAGVDKQSVYESMYMKTLKDLKVTQYILNHFVVDGGVGYYILTKEALETLEISREEGSLFVNTLADIEGIEVWSAITYQEDKNQYRVSLRSRHVPVAPIANKYRGGGHIYASGATLLSLDELDLLIKDIKEAILSEI